MKKTDKESRNKEEKAAIGSQRSLVGTALMPIAIRGRTFEGFVTKKFPKRVVVEFERTVYVKKYERFYKKKTRLHARLPDSMANEVNVGDYIKIRECRPLSKIIHFIVVGKIRNSGDKK